MIVHRLCLRIVKMALENSCCFFFLSCEICSRTVISSIDKYQEEGKFAKLNPIGFIFCEIQKWKDTQNASQNKVKILGLGLLRVLQNPIVFMVFIGIAFNFILDQKVPEYMENFLDGLANSFSGSALFYLGLTMVGKIKKLKKSAFVVLILLITAKL